MEALLLSWAACLVLMLSKMSMGCLSDRKAFTPKVELICLRLHPGLSDIPVLHSLLGCCDGSS